MLPASLCVSGFAWQLLNFSQPFYFLLTLGMVLGWVIGFRFWEEGALWPQSCKPREESCLVDALGDGRGGWERNERVCGTAGDGLSAGPGREPGCWQQPAWLLREKGTLEGA